MQITHVIPTLDPAAGGPPMVALRLAAAQAVLGHDVSIICHDTPGARQAIKVSLDGVPHVGRITLHQLPAGGKREKLLGWGLAKKIAPLLEGRNVVQLHGVWEPILRVSAVTASALRIPYIVMPHGMLDRWSMAQKRMKKRVALALAYNKYLNRSAYIHALNTDEIGPIKELGITAPTRVIPNGVFIEEIEPLPKPGEFRAKHPELADDPFILFLSRLHHKKGLDYLAEAFRGVAEQRPRVHLVVAGPDGGEREPFVKMIRDAGLTDRVHTVGPIYGMTKYEALRDATCFCLPSRQEGFSIAITEALACGTPVVISEPCHFPEVAEVRAGFVLPLDPQRFTQSLVTLLDDRTLRDSMSQNAMALVRQRYTWPKIAEQTLACYRQAGCRDGS